MLHWRRERINGLGWTFERQAALPVRRRAINNRMRSEVVPRRLRKGSRAGSGAPVGFGLGGAAAAGIALACGSSVQQIEIGPPPARDTHAVLAGALCRDNHCRCRDRSAAGDGGAGVPDGKDRKRYEIRLGPTPQDQWVTIDRTTVLYKTPERAEECFYVDLTSGPHQLELRASNPDGVSVALEVHELGTTTRSWYDTFAFACGSPGVCSFDELQANKAQYAARRSVFDRCGTTRVKSISWDHGKAPDQVHPSELLVRFTLDIYRFAAWKQHGDDTCGQGGGRRGPSDEPAPPPDEGPTP